jgi:hypothetical protein
VTFELVWRHGAQDTVIVSFQKHFDPKPGGDFSATSYEDSAPGAAVDARSGDLLILRYTGTNSSNAMDYIPNGDGTTNGGRIPFIDLPQ